MPGQAMTTSDTVIAQLDEGLLKIILNRPDRLNAFNAEAMAMTFAVGPTKGSGLTKPAPAFVGK